MHASITAILKPSMLYRDIERVSAREGYGLDEPIVNPHGHLPLALSSSAITERVVVNCLLSGLADRSQLKALVLHKALKFSLYEHITSWRLWAVSAFLPQ